MSELWGIAVVVVLATTLYELRWYAIAALLILALVKICQFTISWWKESGRKHRAEQLAIMDRADRQNREFLAGDPHGVFGTDQTQVVFRDVADFVAHETEGFTKPLARTPFQGDSESVDETTPLSGGIYPDNGNSSAGEPLPKREFPIYPKPNDWDQVVVVDLDATDRIAS